MSISIWFSGAAFLSATFAGALGCWLWTRTHTATSSYSALAVLLGMVSLSHIADGFSVVDVDHGLLWRRFALAAELFQPAALFYAGARFLNPDTQHDIVFQSWAIRIIGVAGMVLAAFTMTEEVVTELPVNDGKPSIVLASWGRVPYAFIVISTALGLAQLEAVLRASTEPVRYRLKLITVGLGGLAGYQVYQASQMLLLPIWRPEQSLVSSLVAIISLSVLTIGIARSRFNELLVNAYVSQHALVGSVTLIVIGLYLLGVGVIGEWLRRMNQPLGQEFSVVIVFGALVALAVVSLSKTARAEVRGFLTRNFYRAKYDYRAEWLRVTESFQFATNKDAILDHLLDLLIKTFSTTTIAIWVFRDADRRYYQARPKVPEMKPIDLTYPVIRQLVENDEPVMIKGKSGGGPAEAEDLLAQLGAELCFPIRAQGRLIAFVVLGKQPRGEPYGTDDCDLLHGICHHVGTILSHASLAEDRQAAAELEALHRFSVFCLHDLKNLAARLSLVAQNAKQHGHDPAFQKSALITVADTAQKMTNLMSKLSLKSFSPTAIEQAGMVDLSSLIEEVVASLRQDRQVRVHVVVGPVPPVPGVREQIQQVLVNVVLNARQAIAEQGDIAIAVAESNGSAIITVEDTGRGVPPAMLDSLFRPSHSSRPGGLGIGLYQCRKIVEAHGGTIQIRSEEGKGTQVRIALPSAPMGEQRELFVSRKTQIVSRET